MCRCASCALPDIHTSMRTSEGSCKRQKLFPYYHRPPPISRYVGPPRRSKIQEAALRAILLLSLRASASIYRYCPRPSSPFFFSNFPLLFSILLSGYFEIMTLLDTSDYRCGIRPRMTRLLRCIENKRERCFRSSDITHCEKPRRRKRRS